MSKQKHISPWKDSQVSQLTKWLQLIYTAASNGQYDCEEELQLEYWPAVSSTIARYILPPNKDYLVMSRNADNYVTVEMAATRLKCNCLPEELGL